MTYDLAKRNRLNGKFNFNRRDWLFELDGIDDPPQIPLKNGRPKKPPVTWERNGKGRQQDAFNDQDAG